MGRSEVLIAVQLGSWAWAECRQPNSGVYRQQTGMQQQTIQPHAFRELLGAKRHGREQGAGAGCRGRLRLTRFHCDLIVRVWSDGTDKHRLINSAPVVECSQAQVCSRACNARVQQASRMKATRH